MLCGFLAFCSDCQWFRSVTLRCMGLARLVSFQVFGYEMGTKWEQKQDPRARQRSRVILLAPTWPWKVNGALAEIWTPRSDRVHFTSAGLMLLAARMIEGETKEAERFRRSASRSSRFPGLTRPETRPIDGVEVQSYRSARASVKTRPQVARARVHGRDPTGARGPRHTPRGWRRQQRSQHAAIEAGV